MDDDGSKNLDYEEFMKGIQECGLELEEDKYKVTRSTRTIEAQLS